MSEQTSLRSALTNRDDGESNINNVPLTRTATRDEENPLLATINRNEVAPHLKHDRRIAIICAVAAHCAIGGIYTFSLFTDSIARNFGVVGKTSVDWSVSSIIPVFSLTIGVAGLTAAISGTWAERVGPRLPIMLAAVFWGGGIMLSAVALSVHSLWMLYLSYGVLGGLGIGLSYTPPVAGLIKWFPNQKGLASGIVVMGFGCGALLASPAIRRLMNEFFVPPRVLGACGSLKLETDASGAQFADMNGYRARVVVAMNDLNGLGYPQHLIQDLQPGYCYEAGTGGTGAAGTMFVLGIVYMIVLLGAGWAFRAAPADFKGDRPGPSSVSLNPEYASVPVGQLSLPPKTFVPAKIALHTRQFYQVWLCLFLNATAGVALLGVSKNLVYDVFAIAQPETVTPAFCTVYVAMLSLFNGAGRIFWATVSDKIGRKTTFGLFFALGSIIYLLIPFLATYPHHPLSLGLFLIGTTLAVTIYGGGFAISPAYLADLFGTKQVGIVYARLLTAWSAAGLCGPTLLAYLRGKSEASALMELVQQVQDSEAFEARFGKSVSMVEELIRGNALDVASLVEFLQKQDSNTESVHDPRPFMYNSTMYVMSLLLVIGFVNSMTIRAVSRDLWTNDASSDVVSDDEEIGSSAGVQLPKLVHGDE